MRQEQREDRGGQVAHIEAEQGARLGADDERHEHDAADERHGDRRSLNSASADAWMRHDRPVGRRHQRRRVSARALRYETASRDNLTVERCLLLGPFAADLPDSAYNVHASVR